MEKDLTLTEEHKSRFIQRYMGLSEEESKDLVAILNSPTPKDWIDNRPIRGGGVASYVAGSYFIQKLNDAFGFLWSFETPQQFTLDNQVVVKGRLSLRIPGRTITRRLPDGSEETLRFDGFEITKEQFGSSEIKKFAQDIKNKRGEVTYHKGEMMDLGDDYKAAATDAMKKCSTQLGIFLDVYGPRDRQAEKGPSEAQLEAFYTRASKVGMNKEASEAWAKEQLGKPLGEAGQQDILGLTADLIQKAREKS